MDILIQLGILAVSLAVLLKSSDYFVHNAEKIGLAMGVSSFIVGVTIVALGTSLPELATSIISVIYDKSEVVIGNVVGSNITNILLVLGITAVVGKRLYLKDAVIKSELPYLFLTAVILYFIIQDKNVSIAEAIVLLVLLAIYLVQTISQDKQNQEDIERPSVSWKEPLFLIITGIGIYFGADYTIKSLIALSEIFNMDTGVLAQSLVALGTSLPEVSVSIVAVRKGKGDMALGNVIGSNIFNTYGVMGVSALVGSLVIPDGILDFSILFMLMITLALFLLGQAKVIDRWGGATLLVFYVFFLMQLF